MGWALLGVCFSNDRGSKRQSREIPNNCVVSDGSSRENASETNSLTNSKNYKTEKASELRTLKIDKEMISCDPRNMKLEKNLVTCDPRTYNCVDPYHPRKIRQRLRTGKYLRNN